MRNIIENLEKVISAGICTGCGACVALDTRSQAQMKDTLYGPIPWFGLESLLPDYMEQACPAFGVNYPKLYGLHYGHRPESWLVGHIENVYTGFAADPLIRRSGASGGVLTQTLVYLLETSRVDGVILAKQGVPIPEKARAVIATSRKEIIAGAQSVYIPVSILDILRELDTGKKYAITCLPEQSAALRIMQLNGFAPALQIKYVVGPYTGTALYPAVIRCFLRSKRIKDDDLITSLNWRAGEWPGYLEIKTTSGQIIQTPKIYYNFLIPFFVTQTSLQSMDFANEFSDLAVGDAWSSVFESQGVGHSIVVTRTPEMEAIIFEMQETGLLKLNKEDPAKASDMHGHMIDFKKNGGWLRNQWRRKTGRLAPHYGYRPVHIPISRILVEMVINGMFAVGKTRIARWLISVVPESFIGPVFNHLRLGWKEASRPTKRKRLSGFKVKIVS